MGKFEKLVVLTVLFVAAVVLALSLNRNRSEVEAADPLEGARRVLGREEGAREEREAPLETPLARFGRGGSSPATEGEAPSLMLHAGGESEYAPAGLRPSSARPEPTLSSDSVSDGERRVLVDTNGLRPSFLDAYMTYVVQQGDTWSTLAQRFYQDGRYTRNLHLANDDLEELAPGKEILVPVFDLLAAEASGSAGTDASSRGSVGQLSQNGAGAPAAKPTKPLDDKGTESKGPESKLETRVQENKATYVVRTGDTLSDISVAVFGTATRWKEILEANRDLLQRPESLQVGMKLKIPQGGKLPLPGPGDAQKAKSAAKPTTAKAAGDTASAPKKKKVL